MLNRILFICFPLLIFGFKVNGQKINLQTVDLVNFNPHYNSWQQDSVCKGHILLKATAFATQCTKGKRLQWKVLIDIENNGGYDFEFSSTLQPKDTTLTNDSNNNGIIDAYIQATYNGWELKIPAFTVDILDSKHKVWWQVQDGCGNTVIKETMFTIIDNKPPYVSGYTIYNSFPDEIFAIDCGKAFDNCTPQSALWFTFNNCLPVLSNLRSEHYFKGRGILANEEEFLNGEAQKWMPKYQSSVLKRNQCDFLELKLSVWDDHLNTDSTTVNLSPMESPKFGVHVEIKDKNGNAVKYCNATGIVEQDTFRACRVNDYYYIGYWTQNFKMKITPTKIGHNKEGIDNKDLVKLQRHLLGIVKLTLPAEILAADVNRDNILDTKDLVELRKKILGLPSSFEKEKAWRFYPSDYNFESTMSPLNAPEYKEVTNTMPYGSTVHFTAIRLGDIDTTIK